MSLSAVSLKIFEFVPGFKFWKQEKNIR